MIISGTGLIFTISFLYNSSISSVDNLINDYGFNFNFDFAFNLDFVLVVSYLMFS